MKQRFQSKLLAMACAIPMVSFLSLETLATTYPEIQSESAIVINATTGKILYEKSADYGMAPSSMAGIMTAYIAYEEVQLGNLTWDTEINITAEQVAKAESLWLDVPHTQGTATLESLVKLIFLRADPIAALAIAEHIGTTEEIFVSRMNKTANRLSMNAVYTDSNGLSPHHLTVRSQARLLQVFQEQFPQMSQVTSLTYTTYQGNVYDNQNLFLHTSSDYYNSSYTGLMIADNDYANTSFTTTASLNGLDLVTVVFDADNIWQAYSDSATLMSYGYNAFDQAPTHFHDTADYPVLDLVYQNMRELGVNLQPLNGWVRPTELMTFGEFGITLTTTLEQVGLIKNTTLYSGVVDDIEDYCYKDVLLRGIEIGLLPLQADGNFHPDDLLTMSNIEDFLDNIITSFGLVSQGDLPPLIPEEEVVRPNVSYDSTYDKDALFLGVLYPLNNAITSGIADAGPEPRSIQKDYISRGYATQLLYEFILKYDLI